jgi:GntR family transcriptional regulator
MYLVIDPANAVPVYVQIIEQIKRAIAARVLRPGEALPSLRETARNLRVNTRTVANAYKQLEIEGVVETRHGAGTFVKETVESGDGFRRETLAKALDSVLLEAFQMEFSFSELQSLFEDRVAHAVDTYAAEHENGGNDEKR